jgi:hypothetical protein
MEFKTSFRAIFASAWRVPVGDTAALEPLHLVFESIRQVSGSEQSKRVGRGPHSLNVTLARTDSVLSSDCTVAGDTGEIKIPCALI